MQAHSIMKDWPFSFLITEIFGKSDGEPRNYVSPIRHNQDLYVALVAHPKYPNQKLETFEPVSMPLVGAGISVLLPT